MAFPSVGATMNLVMYAVIGNFANKAENVALEPEPEVVTLIDYLNNCGANIDFDIDSRKIKVVGVARLTGCLDEKIYESYSSYDLCCYGTFV